VTGRQRAQLTGGRPAPPRSRARLWIVGAAALLLAAAAFALPLLFRVRFDPVTRNTLAFLSDTQAPTFFETLRLRRHHNEKATRMIFDRILAQQGLAAVFWLGDLTSAASNNSNWAAVDGFLDRLKRAGIPAFAALGNHEYMHSTRAGLANFHKRFPELTRSWYSVRVGPAAVIILNSNLKELSPGERAEQMDYYRLTLSEFDRDPAVRGVLVGIHHPPFTNSRIVSPSARVREDIVPPFFESPKGLLFLSGHAHAAEHFEAGGKDFLVLGGGGGLLQPLLLGAKRKFTDIFSLKGETRFFHFLTVRLDPGGLLVTYEMLRRDFSGFDPVGRFRVPWAPSAGRTKAALKSAACISR
jgi:hypothetical protein